MRRPCRFVAALLVLIAPGPAAAAPADLNMELERVLPLLQSQGLSVSVLFSPAAAKGGPAGATVSASANEPRIPASVTKLFTAAAALDLLGSRFRFRTRVARLGSLNDGVIEGDLFVIGNGDPFLVSERLWMLSNQLRLAGVRTITGNLIIDSSSWRELEDYSSFAESDRAYAALPSAISVNFNALTLRIEPGKHPGDPVKVSQDPFDVLYLGIENRLRTGTAGSAADWRLDLRPARAAPQPPSLSQPDSAAVSLTAGDLVSAATAGQASGDSAGSMANTDPGADPSNTNGPETTELGVTTSSAITYPIEIARLEGTVPAGHDPFLAYRRALDPLAFAGSLLRAFLEAAGISVSGEIRVGTTPAAAIDVLAFESRPLSELIDGMNRYSNNFIANQLLLAVGVATQPPDSLVESSDPLVHAGAALSTWLRDRVGSGDPSTFADGSGLSTLNRVTARTVVALLQFAWNDLELHGPFVGSLPGPGEDGTLNKRLRGARGVTVRGKTGTLGDTGVSSLAGYLQAGEQPPVAFAILLHSRSEQWSLSEMRELQDRWIEIYAR